MSEHNIKHITSSAYNPTGNSVVERMNQTIGNSLRCLRSTPLKEAVDKTSKGICYSYHQTLGCSPFEALHNKNPFNSKIKVNSNRQTILRNKIKQAEKDLKRTNRNRLPHIYNPGDMVYIKCPFYDKMEVRWQGPFPVETMDTKRNYAIIRKNKRQERVNVNVKRLRPLKHR
ncbi:Gag-Pol polyprotein [Nosema granulosis]|uniref:Gag-Pol polyprotein n=1 Tax=Nosema granulosis TaxID=83296 RepID=A0A9P6GWZ0_9MICR|nr:Gag-Pol polyprotein [Nosema granulosis]